MLKQALQEDFNLRASFNVRALPAYLFCYGDRQVLKTGVPDFDGFAQTVHSISDGLISPEPPVLNKTVLQNFLQNRPLVSYTEIRHAFNLADNRAVTAWLDKIADKWRTVNRELIEAV